MRKWGTWRCGTVPLHVLVWAVMLLGCVEALQKKAGVQVGAIGQHIPFPSDVMSEPADHSSSDTTNNDGRRDGESPEILSDVPDEIPGDVEERTDVDATDVEWDVEIPLDVWDSDVCLPDCDDRECGQDGCGGSCGLCPDNKPVCSFGKCVACSPDCVNKECGPDGCGKTCGTCPQGFSCEFHRCQPPQCLPSVPLFQEDFSSCSPGQFDVIDYDTADSVAWWGTSMAPRTAPCSLYLGDLASLTYDTGDRVRLELVSPLIAIPSGGIHALVFFVRLALELVPAPEYPYDYDVLYLYADIPNVGSELLWSSKQLLNTTGGEYVPVALNLVGLSGYTVRFRFSFDTFDSIDNEHFGVLLDDLVVQGLCPFCSEDSHCDDEDDCTVDQCLSLVNTPGAGGCFHWPVAEECLL